MEVEVTEIFAPAAGKRPANFIVLKYFLLGMLFSNGIESILIVPRTLHLMELNEKQLEKLGELYDEHDAFKTQLHEYRKMTDEMVKNKDREFMTVIGREDEYDRDTAHGKKVAEKPKVKHVMFEENEEPMASNGNDTLVEYLLLGYGIITLALGIFAVFKEIDKLLMVFIAVVILGLVILFFSGLTLIVFMAILNDIIIGLISFKYLQMMNEPVQATYAFGAGGQFVEASYNVDLGGPSAINA